MMISKRYHIPNWTYLSSCIVDVCQYKLTNVTTNSRDYFDLVFWVDIINY